MVQRSRSSFATVRLMPSIEMRSFVDGVLLDVFGQCDMQPPILRVGDALEFDQLADAIDVALHDVASEAAVGLHGQFEIHQRAFVNARERSADPGFGGEIGAERSGLDVKRGEADSADGDAVVRSEFFRSMFGGDGDAPVFAALLRYA